jgi:hypothetical protein
MWKSARSKAEEKFAATQKKFKQAAKEREKVRQKELERTANLRALRLAKEAAEQENAEVKEPAKNKTASNSPQAPRRESPSAQTQARKSKTTSE